MARVRFRLETEGRYRLTEELPEWDAELYCASLASGQSVVRDERGLWRRAVSAFVLRDPPPVWRRALGAARRMLS